MTYKTNYAICICGVVLSHLHKPRPKLEATMFSKKALHISALAIFIAIFSYSLYRGFGMVLPTFCALGIVLTGFLMMSPSPEDKKKIFAASTLVGVFLLSVMLYDIEIPEGQWVSRAWLIFEVSCWVLGAGVVGVIIWLLRKVVHPSRMLGSAHSIPWGTIKERKLTVIILLVGLVNLSIWLFLRDDWKFWYNHNADLFWPVNLGVILTLWFALSGVLGATGGKWMAWIFAVLFACIFANHFSKTDTYKDWKKANEASAVANDTVSRMVALPSGTLWSYPGKVKGMVEKTKFPEKYSLKVKNIDIVDDPILTGDNYFDFDTWNQNYGTYGEFRWDKNVDRGFGTYVRRDSGMSGVWFLELVNDRTREYRGWCEDIIDGEKWEVPITLFVDRR